MRDYEAAINREQVTAGVTSKQAALTYARAVNGLLQAIASAATTALSEGKPRIAMCRHHGCSLYSFLFFSGGRLAGILPKAWKDVEVLPLLRQVVKTWQNRDPSLASEEDKPK